jgi:hypothetical protein
MSEDMRDLWRGLALLALDKDLRNEVLQIPPDFKPDDDLASGIANVRIQRLNLRNQPHLSALQQIDEKFRARGLCLGVYALAEVNRWILDGKSKFVQALEGFGDELQISLPPDALRNPRSLEAIGALVSDTLLRERFAANTDGLRNNGFEISTEEEAALRSTFAPTSQATRFADQIFQLGWSGTLCLARVLVPREQRELLHPNM